jgi:tetratricopeptide (TPR) repeat protein
MSAALDGTIRLWDARPLTPDLSAELEAVALLDSLFARPLPRSAVKSIVGDRLNIAVDVRQRALELADLHAEETDPLRYYVSAWPVLRHPYANEFMTESALAQTTAASTLHGMEQEFKKNGGWYANYLNQDGKVILMKTNQPDDYLFLGMAHYRMGRFKNEHYKEALAILSKCRRSTPTPLAFLAMTHQQLGQHEQAQAALTRLQEAVKTASPDQARDGQVFLAEAETLIRR